MVVQILIAVTGIAAVWLSQDTRIGARRYACIFGLAGQPFWFYASYSSEQWGIFILAFFYTFAWLKGIYYFWLKKDADQETH